MNQAQVECQLCRSPLLKLMANPEHCLRCDRVVCSKCYWGRLKVHQMQGGSSLLRCCRWCHHDNQAIENIITDHRLVFGQTCKIGESWARKAIAQSTRQELIQQFNDSLGQSNDSTSRWKGSGRIEMNQLLQYCNVSLRQFLAALLQSVSPVMVEETLTTCLVAVYGHMPALPFSSALVFVVTYFLCFCNQFDCYLLVTRILQRVYPQFSQLLSAENANNSGEVEILSKMFAVLHTQNNSQVKQNLTRLMTDSLASITGTLTINLTTVSLSLHIIGEMINRWSSSQLYKGVTSIVYQCKDCLTLNSHILQRIQHHAVFSVNLESAKTDMAVIPTPKTNKNSSLVQSSTYVRQDIKNKQVLRLLKKSEQTCKILQDKVDELEHKLEVTNQELSQSSKKLRSLQQSMLGRASQMVEAQECLRIKHVNQELKTRVTSLTEQIVRCRKSYTMLEKKVDKDRSEVQAYKRLRRQQQERIAELATQNQLYRMHHQLTEDPTDIGPIKQTLNRKNNALAEAHHTIEQLRVQVQMLTSKLQENSNRESMPLETWSLASKQQSSGSDLTQFRKYMEMSLQLNKQLKNDLSVSQEARNRAQEELLTFREERKVLQVRADRMGQVEEAMKELGQQPKYEQCMRILTRLISSQVNQRIKQELEQVQYGLEQCIQQTKVRYLDCRIKANKIQQLQSIAKPVKLDVTGDQTLSEVLSWVSDPNRVGNSPVSSQADDCRVM